MRRIQNIAAIAVVALLIGCVSQQRATFNTLASVQAVTSGAYNVYLDLVVQKQIPTNSVPAVSRDFNTFQTIWSAAVIVARWNTNSTPTEVVIDAAGKVLNGINAAKKGK